MSALVTVGLPVFNGEEFLSDAIDSIRAQTYADFELIISDNGSTDATARICRDAARADPRIRYLRSEVNRGGTWNYMRVARAARTPFFSWMAADDVKLPRFLESCVGALEADPDAVLAVTRTSLIDAEDVVFEDLNDERMGLDASTPHERVRNVLGSQGSHVMYGVIRTAALRRTRGMLAMVGDDMVLLTELACQGRMLVTDERLFLQRRHRGQLALRGHEQVKWHAPDADVRFAFPQTRLNAELYRAVASMGLSPAQTACCWARIGPAWVLPRWRGMARDLATALGIPLPAVG